MVSVLVVTRGKLADELVASTKRLGGDVSRLASLSLDETEDAARARKKIDRSISELDAGDGVILLTDTFGGGVTDVALTFLKVRRVEIVTGANLPMLVKFTGLSGPTDLEATAAQLAAQGREAIQVATEILGKGPPKT